jgi:nitroreductase
MIRDLIAGSRSCRRFHEDVAVDRKTLEALVDLARLSPSAANLQPLKYLLFCDPQDNARIFPHLAWAGYLRDWPGPDEGERPAAYIVILGDTQISSSFGCDHGIACQSILLGAAERHLAGCIIGLIQREALHRELDIPARYEVLLVIALGKPREKTVIDKLRSDGSIEYWRDDEGVHHVPKRPLEELVLNPEHAGTSDSPKPV